MCTSIGYPKHSYEIDLQEDISLLQLPKDDDWILNANYIDKSILRHVISYELFSNFSNKNISSECKFLELSINGEYNGLYILMEKLDKSTLDIQSSDTMAMMFKEPHLFRETYNGIVPQNPNNYHQQTYPKISKFDKRQYLESIRNLILTSSDITFNQEITQYFDLEKIIDWHILLLITNNSDGILKNFYLFKQSENAAIRIAPWDYDHSFGRDRDNQLNLNETQADLNRPILFRRLLEFGWYKNQRKQRWFQLKNLYLINKDDLKQRINNKITEIQNLTSKNSDRWPLDAGHYYDNNDFDAEIEIMYKYLDLRMTTLATYFKDL